MKVTKPKKLIYFDYFAEIEPWLINKYPKYEQNIKKELADEIDEMFRLVGIIGYCQGFVSIELSTFKYNFLQSKWAENIIKDLISLNDSNSDIIFYINCD